MAHIYHSQLDAYDLYHEHKEKTAPKPTAALPALGHALAGSTGTAISNLCIYPLDLIITRLQVQRQLRASSKTPVEGEYAGVLDAAKQIYEKEGGISAFYTGVIPDTGKSIADSFLFFLFYNYLRQNRLQKHGGSATTLPVLDELTVGALAGACSKFFTTPIANIVTRKQTASMIAARSSDPLAKGLTVSEIASKIREEKGLQGFWSGYSASLVLTLNPSITFFLYEFQKRYLLPRSQRDNPGIRMTFLMAAISKAIASTITYPFSLAKARAQAGSKPPVNVEAVQDVKNEAEMARANNDAAQAKAASLKANQAFLKSTVFNTILNIYREDGLSALYDGIWGEVCKGFFSHGITMLVKEAVHKLIIQLYFMLLNMLKKTPSTDDVVNQARSVADQANSTASTAYAQVSQTASDVTKDVNTRLGDAYGQVSTMTGNATDSAKVAAADVYNRAISVGSNVTDTIRTGASDAYDMAAKQTGAVTTGTNDAAGPVDYQFASNASAAKSATIDAYGKAAANDTSVSGSANSNAVNAYERAAVLGSNANETAKSTAIDAYEKAAAVGSNANETAKSGAASVYEKGVDTTRSAADIAGRTLENAGKSLKSAAGRTE